MGKRVKQVDGVRVLYRYSLSIIFTGLFCLAIAACSVLSFFLPIAIFKPSEGAPVMVKGLDLIFSLMIWDGNFILKNPLYKFFVENAPGGTLYDIAQIVKWVMFAGGIFLVLAAIFDFFLALKGLWLVLVGKSHHLKSPKVLAGWSFSMHLMEGLVFWGLFGVGLWFGYNGITGSWTLYMTIVYAAVPLVSLIVIASIYSVMFRYYIYANELGELRRNSSPNTIQEPYLIDRKTETQVKVQYKFNKGLPAKISYIGGHEYSSNSHLEQAIIPEGIKSIGIGAFSNCLNLQIVSIPKSMKQIKANAFFNCRRLRRINYAGTKEEFANIVRGSNWLLKAGTSTVVCSNGAIIVDQLK